MWPAGVLSEAFSIEPRERPRMLCYATRINHPKRWDWCFRPLAALIIVLVILPRFSFSLGILDMGERLLDCYTASFVIPHSV